MAPNPFLGVILHAIGGLASASFYLPYNKVRNWAWESYWLAGGFFSWIIMPWFMAWLIVPHLMDILRVTPINVLILCYAFGAMWGIGGLTFGLTMRYLGIGLGMAIALGYCAAFGTLMPPIFNGKIVEIIHNTPGQVVLLGVAVCLLGIAFNGIAGMRKEKEMPEEDRKAVVKEYNFTKGILVATFSGIMSSGMAYGIAAGKPICDLAVKNGTLPTLQNVPALVVVLAGGFTVNFIWCAILNIKNGTWRDYFRGFCKVDEKGERVFENSDAYKAMMAESNVQSDGHGVAVEAKNKLFDKKVPMLSNYFFSAIAGITWYMQFFFYGMGTTKMGKYDFSSWTLHMASIIIFSTIWGILLHEWKGTSKKVHVLVAWGLFILVSSTIVVGYGNYLNTIVKP